MRKSGVVKTRFLNKWGFSCWTMTGHLSNIVSRCDKPLNIRGMLMTEYFKPHTLHPYQSMIRAGIVIAFVAILVASVVAMIRHASKEPVRNYRQFQDIRLQDFSLDQI